MPGPLGNGARIAILGGGPAGACTAAALLACARRLGRVLEVCVYQGGSGPDELAEPLAIDQATVVRLASLGIGVPLGFLSSYRGVAFHGVSAGAPLFTLPKPVTLVTAGSPAAAFRRLLRGVAAGFGARLVPCPANLLAGAPANGRKRALEVRSRGLVQAAERVLLASGARAPLDSGAPRAPELRAGSCLWLGATRPFPRRFGGWLHVFATGGRGGSLWVHPVGQRLFAAGGCGQAELLDRIALLQRDGLLPIELTAERAWDRPYAAGLARRAGDDPRVLPLGEAAGALWPLSAFPVAVAEALRLAEDLLALPEDAARSHPARAVEARRAAAARLRMLARANGLDPRRAPVARALGWMFENAPGPPPALPWRGARAAWRGWKRRLGHARRAPRPPGTGASALVYVVDDDATSRSLLARYLEERGLQVRTFADELQLRSRAARELPTAILLDVVLRRVDGVTLLGWLRADPATREIPVVLMSGAQPCLGPVRIRAYAFLPKPLDLRQLWEVLRPLIAGAPGPSATLARSGCPA